MFHPSTAGAYLSSGWFITRTSTVHTGSDSYPGWGGDLQTEGHAKRGLHMDLLPMEIE